MANHALSAAAIAVACGLPYLRNPVVRRPRGVIAVRLVNEVRSGMIHINQGTGSQGHMPFGGIGDQGFGNDPVGPFGCCLLYDRVRRL